MVKVMPNRRRIIRIHSMLAALALLFVEGPTRLRSQGEAPIATDLTEEFRVLAQQLSKQPPDDCAPLPNSSAEVAYQEEDKLFRLASQIVLLNLRAHPAEAVRAARDSLNGLRAISEAVDTSWPEGERFNF